MTDVPEVAPTINDKQEQFVKMASHDLRNHMSTIKWYTEMLLDGDMGELTSDQKKYIEVIASSNQKALDLIASFLNQGKTV